MRGTLVRIVNEDLRALLPELHLPVLLIWGEHDAEAPLEDGRLMERLIPDAGLVVFEGAGHFAYLEQPARFCRIVDVFLHDNQDQGTA
jgi:pimeloyl-ACP methyl ester carboxylesterase